MYVMWLLRKDAYDMQGNYTLSSDYKDNLGVPEEF